jgi:hypothetical protein
MANRYEYKSLNQSTSDIRLLRLLPNDGNDKLKNIPACQIFHTSLNRNSKFVALSYVWGDTKSSRIILVDKCPVGMGRDEGEGCSIERATASDYIHGVEYLEHSRSAVSRGCDDMVEHSG